MSLKFIVTLALTVLSLNAQIINLDRHNQQRYLECIRAQKTLPGSGWIKSFFLYGKGMACADALLDSKRPDFYSLSSLETLSGISVDSRSHSQIVAKNQYSWEGQLFINPNFITWLSNNGIVSDKNSALFALAHDVYLKHQAFIHSFKTAYDYITTQNDFKKELILYKKKIVTGYVLRHLFDRYEKEIKRLYPKENAHQIIFGIGFWMRREIDNSKQAVHQLLLKLINNYESDVPSKDRSEGTKTPSMKW